MVWRGMACRHIYIGSTVIEFPRPLLGFNIHAKPLKFQLYHSDCIYIKFDSYYFYFYLFWFWCFLKKKIQISSLSILFHLIFVLNLVSILLIIIFCHLLFFLILFFKILFYLQFRSLFFIAFLFIIFFIYFVFQFNPSQFYFNDFLYKNLSSLFGFLFFYDWEFCFIIFCCLSSTR